MWPRSDSYVGADFNLPSGATNFSEIKKFSIEYVSMPPKNVIEIAPVNTGQESVEKKLKTDNKLIFDIHLGSNCLLLNMHLAGIDLIPFSEFSVFGIQTRVLGMIDGYLDFKQNAMPLINVKSEDIQKYSEYGLEDYKKEGYRKMTGTRGEPENIKGYLRYHPLIVPVKTNPFDDYYPYGWTPPDFPDYYKDVSQENFIQLSKQYQELRVEFEFNDALAVHKTTDLKLWLGVATNLPSHMGGW